MTKTKTYEGQDIGVLLERVRTEHGPDAKIVGANRCRTGGLAGFFAVESFEVIVELDRAEGDDGSDRKEKRRRLRADRAGANAAVAAPRRASRRNDRSEDPDPSPGLAALLDAADNAERRAAFPERRAERNPASADFSAALDRAVRRGLNDDEDEVSPPGRRVSARRLKRSERKLRTRKTPRAARSAGAERVVDIAALERAGLVPSLAPAREHSNRRVGAVRNGDEVSTATLAELGLPHAWLAPYASGYASLQAVLGNLTPAPPMVTGPGVTIAVVGEIDGVIDVARSISVALHQEPDSCVLVSTQAAPGGFRGQVISVLDELGDHRERWARRPSVTVVAIDIGFARQDISWGRLAIAAVQPSMRWGVISSTRKGEDVRAWAGGIGGLHALAVTSMAETTSPADILSAGVPVARIDGQLANADLWARILRLRLSDSPATRTSDLVPR